MPHILQITFFISHNRRTLGLTDQERFMKEAIRQAKKARALEEVPIGCVIVCDGQIIARGYNRRNTDKNTLSHAELNAIKKASKKLGDWRLEGCTMYVTLEPCQMCAGALMQSRIRPCGDRKHEPQSRMRRLGFESSGNGRIQPQGGSNPRRFAGRVLLYAVRFFQRASGKEENAEKISGRTGWKFRKIVV